MMPNDVLFYTGLAFLLLAAYIFGRWTASVAFAVRRMRAEERRKHERKEA
jgi:hypothetical protein